MSLGLRFYIPCCIPLPLLLPPPCPLSVSHSHFFFVIFCPCPCQVIFLGLVAEPCILCSEASSSYLSQRIVAPVSQTPLLRNFKLELTLSIYF
jgi:hypothetical protein